MLTIRRTTAGALALAVLALAGCGTQVAYDAEPVDTGDDRACFSVEKEVSSTVDTEEVQLGTFCREGEGPALLEDDETFQDD